MNTSLPSFESLFGTVPAVVQAAPGRVNLIGDHTDYQDGLVLPMAIAPKTTVELEPREDDQVHVVSSEAATPGTYNLGDEHQTRTWLDYVMGVTWSARAETLWQVRLPLRGFNARITSDVPLGSGLSSSASLEVALLRALRAAFGWHLDDVTLARVAHHAETQLVGAPVGLMDQMAASLGDATTALYLDTRSLAWQKLRLPTEWRVVVIDSGIKHSHVSGGYRLRRAESEAAARALGLQTLRDASVADLPRIGALPALLGKRARHIVTENDRVEAAVHALKTSDGAFMGALMRASHASLRDDYEVTVPEVDALVDVANAMPSVLGARMTGGGFGGAVVAITASNHDAQVGQRIVSECERLTGRRAIVLIDD